MCSEDYRGTVEGRTQLVYQRGATAYSKANPRASKAHLAEAGRQAVERYFKDYVPAERRKAREYAKGLEIASK